MDSSNLLTPNTLLQQNTSNFAMNDQLGSSTISSTSSYELYQNSSRTLGGSAFTAPVPKDNNWDSSSFNDNHPGWTRGNLPKKAVEILKAWLFERFEHPYPSEEEKQALARQTNLSITQVNNWFVNARVRIWKPMMEAKKLSKKVTEDASKKEQGSKSPTNCNQSDMIWKFSDMLDDIDTSTATEDTNFSNKNSILQAIANMSNGNTGSRGNLPKGAVEELKTWLFNHFQHPYPSDNEKETLAKQTRLTLTQVNNWFINARRRIWRPIVDKDKKNPQTTNGEMMPNFERFDFKTVKGPKRYKPSGTSVPYIEISKPLPPIVMPEYGGRGTHYTPDNLNQLFEETKRECLINDTLRTNIQNLEQKFFKMYACLSSQNHQLLQELAKMEARFENLKITNQNIWKSLKEASITDEDNESILPPTMEMDDIYSQFVFDFRENCLIPLTSNSLISDEDQQYLRDLSKIAKRENKGNASPSFYESYTPGLAPTLFSCYYEYGLCPEVKRPIPRRPTPADNTSNSNTDESQASAEKDQKEQ